MKLETGKLKLVVLILLPLLSLCESRANRLLDDRSINLFLELLGGQIIKEFPKTSN